MGWEVGYDENWNRDIGYGVPCVCDHPRCKSRIDRGLSYVCGGEPYGGDNGCGLYFCVNHGGGTLCERCAKGKEPFSAKEDIKEWTHHKMTHPSWKEWRERNNCTTPPSSSAG